MRNTNLLIFKLFILLFIISINPVLAQDNQIQISIGPSFHGTGDLLGFNYGIEYGKTIKKKFSWYISSTGSIHDGFSENIYEYPAGRRVDGSYRFTTAGIQIGYHISYSLIKSKKNDLYLRLGGIIRYQSSSYYDELSIYYPPATGLPFPVTEIVNKTPQRTLAIGATPQIAYTFTTKKKICFGFITGFQLDTNGDVISNLSFTMGKRF
jgi:hypothetical protein